MFSRTLWASLAEAAQAMLAASYLQAQEGVIDSGIEKKVLNPEPLNPKP